MASVAEMVSRTLPFPPPLAATFPPAAAAGVAAATSSTRREEGQRDGQRPVKRSWAVAASPTQRGGGPAR